RQLVSGKEVGYLGQLDQMNASTNSRGYSVGVASGSGAKVCPQLRDHRAKLLKGSWRRALQPIQLCQRPLQVLTGHGFEQVVNRIHFESLERISVVRSGEDDPRLFRQSLDQVETGHARHFNVEKEHVHQVLR